MFPGVGLRQALISSVTLFALLLDYTKRDLHTDLVRVYNMLRLWQELQRREVRL